MISLPSELSGELTKDVQHAKHIISMDFISGTVRYTDCDQNVYYSGNWYKSFPIKFDSISSGPTLEAITVDVTISNVEKKFSRLVHAEETRGKVCQISRVLLTKNLTVIGTPILLLYGYTDTIHIDKREAKISIADDLIKWKTQIPRRMHDEHCTWKDFKGTECQYAGAETWCDRTSARCRYLNNYINFGGFSHVVDLMTKEVWWGRATKSWTNYVSYMQQIGR